MASVCEKRTGSISAGIAFVRLISAMAANNGSAKLVASFVQNMQGREMLFCRQPGDPPGLYALFFNQGQLHGSHMVTVGVSQAVKTGRWEETQAMH